MFRFFLIFVAALLVLMGLELTHAVQTRLVLPWTEALARLCSFLIRFADDRVVAYGNILQSQNGFAVAIQPGCNGVEACIVLAAGILAFPANWKLRIAGLTVGVLAIQLANILRVISLFYLGQWSIQWFEFAHLYLWQILIMLDVLIVWLLWIRVVGRHTTSLAT